MSTMRKSRSDIYAEEYKLHLSTWGPHCGAPQSVFKGHLDALLKVFKSHVAEQCSITAFVHSQYPIETEYEKGYAQGRRDAAEDIAMSYGLREQPK